MEELQLTLSLQADDQLPQGAVNITPAVAIVRLHDSSCKFLFSHGFSLTTTYYVEVVIINYANMS